MALESTSRSRPARRALAVPIVLLLGAVPAAAADIYYSVGTSAADLKTGAPTIRISGGLATLSVAQTGNVGVGDELDYDVANTKAYVTAVSSSTQFVVRTATGSVPPNVGPVTLNATRRAFNTIAAAESGSTNAAHLNTANLVAANHTLTWVCYNDGPFNVSTTTTISGYTTDATRFITLTVASAAQVASGISQRHSGIEGTGARMERLAGGVIALLDVDQAYTRVEWLELDGNSVASTDGIVVNAAATNALLQNLVIHDTAGPAPEGSGITLVGGATSARVRNSFVYDYVGDGLYVLATGANASNVTFYNGLTNPSSNGIQVAAGGTALAENVIAAGGVGLNQFCAAPVGGGCAGTLTCNNCLSSDLTADDYGGSGNLVSMTAANQFVSTAAVPNLHLRAGANAIDAGKDLSGSFGRDIDGDLRSLPWDIGADELGGGGTCCALGVSEGTGTLTVTGAAAFRMRFNAAVGGGIDQLFDLVEDPTATFDLAGGVNDLRTLHDFEVAPASGPFAGVNHQTDDNSAGAEVDLLEFTSTRVRVRQEAFFQADGGTNILGGLKGIGDYSVYGSGRAALRWTETDSNAAAFFYARRQIGMTAHYTAGAPLSSYTPCYEGNPACNSSGGGGGQADWLLGVRNVANARTDFLTILAQDWTQATTVEYLAINTAGIEFSDQVWQEQPGGGANAVPSQSWNLLTYFKPTNLGTGASPWLDPAVISRSNDHRTPSTLAVLVGGPWLLASENTGGGDDYNEAEGAYALTMSPANGLTFRIDGSVATPRYKPFFKMREWRSLTGPGSVTLQGAPLNANVDYRADVKPVSRAHYAQDFLWHSTLQDAAAVSAPDVGTGGTSTGVAFGAARYGQGATVSAAAPGQALSFPVTVTGVPTGNFDPSFGGVDFWFKPAFASTNGLDRDLAGFYVDANNNWMLQKLAANTLRFRITAGGAVSDCTIPAANYSWRAADWVHIRIQWDSTAPGIASQQTIFINGVAPTQNRTGVDYDDANLNLGAGSVPFLLGDVANGDGIFGAGIYDEPHSWGGSENAPDALAHGGLTSDGTEYLADSGRSFDFAFDPIDGFKRNSYAYFGADSQFRGLNVGLERLGVGVADDDLDWEYWNGTAWTNLESVGGFTDTTRSFKRNGSVFWQDPPTWAPYSVNGGPDLYYVRVHLKPTSAGYSSPLTTPIEGLIKTDILLLQYCGDITAAAQEFVIGAPLPTAVTLQSFTATAADGAVDLAWVTASELQNLGFHLYRSPSTDGPYDRITSSVIPGLGSSPTGASYSYRDGGLVSSQAYFYELEDIDTSGQTRRHGPVRAVPTAGGGGGGGSGDPGGSGGTGGGGASSERAYGDAGSPSLRIVERGPSHALLELRTPGFRAVSDSDGSVHLDVPGFEMPGAPGSPAVPVKRVLVDAVAGRGAHIASVQTAELVGFTGLQVATEGAPEAVVTSEGMVRPGFAPRRAARGSDRGGYYPRAYARLLGTVFQGETKKAQLELSPLRYDPNAGQVVLARRLLVRVEFTGIASREKSLGGGRGRRPPLGVTRGKGVVAQLVTPQAGLYRVPFERVFPGVRRGVPVASLRLSRRGETVRFHVEPDRALFGPGSFLYFVGGGDLNPNGDMVYELETGRAGARMEIVSAPPSGPDASTYQATQRFEENRYYQAGLLDAPDLWLWDLMVSPVSKNHDFTVSHVEPGSAGHLKVWLQGGSDFEADPDHHVRVKVNGSFVAEASWDGKREQVVEAELAPGLLQEGTNTLTLENVADTPADYSMVFLNRFEVTGSRNTVAEGGRLDGLFTQSGSAAIFGLTPGSLVLDTTDAPRWVSGGTGGAGVIRFRAEAGRHYLAVDPAATLSPEVRFVPRGLRSANHRADWLLLAPREFLPPAQPLVDLRREQGLVAKTVALEDVYQEFGFGEAGPEAIRAFLEHAWHNWKKPSPRYVVLLGDSTYDPKDYLGTHVADRLPFHPVKTSFLWTASDLAYAAVNGDDLVPDLAIGRLPAGSAAEAERLVAKVVAFERAEQTLGGKAVLVADNADVAGAFEADADDLATSVLQGREVQKIYLRDLGAGATRTEIGGAFDSGASLLSYIGHGGTAVWASENVFNNQDIGALGLQARQPLLLTLNCLNGFFHFPPLNSLAEELVKAEGKGAIAAFAPSGLSLQAAAHVYHKAVLAEITSGRHPRLGDALLAAQSTYADTGAFPELLSIYHLFGDPAMTVR